MTLSTDTQKSLEEQISDWGHPRLWPRKDLHTPEECLDIEQSVLEIMQLRALKDRFLELKTKISSVKELAERQGITEIKSLNDIVPILFNHTVYKSYPLSLIEKKQFDKMTSWISKFSIFDLSNVHLDNPKTIDEWLNQLESQSEILVVHSSGTSGKLSFLPRSNSDMENYRNGLYMIIEKTTGINFHEERVPVFFAGYRNGRQLAQRIIGYFGPLMAGSEEEYITAFPGFMSADFMSLAGRVKAAKAKGELGKLQLIKSLVHNKGELIKMKKNSPKMMESFINRLLTEYQGKRVFFMGVWQSIIETALIGQEKGLRQVFKVNSGFATGGGMKGWTPPVENWYELTCDFYGVKEIRDMYGMTEINGGGIPSCSANHYHLTPWLITFILDPETSDIKPREGIQTGRFAFFDLLAETYWGGFITGDAVTIHYEQCHCGLRSAWFENNIRRYSELKGGDDKISCAGIQEAYDDFIDFLTNDEND